MGAVALGMGGGGMDSRLRHGDDCSAVTWVDGGGRCGVGDCSTSLDRRVKDG